MDKLEIELSEMRKKINNLEFYVMRLISKIDKVLETKELYEKVRVDL